MCAAPLPVPDGAPIISDHVYLQPMDGGKAKRLLVRRSDFVIWDDDTRGNWFHTRLVKMAHDPLIEDAGDGLPVYYVDVKARVMHELVCCAKNPDHAKRAMDDVPRAIKSKMDLPTWIEMLEKFGLERLDETPLPTGPEEKKEKRSLPEWFPTAAQVRTTAKSATIVRDDTDKLLVDTIYAYGEIARTHSHGNYAIQDFRLLEKSALPALLRHAGYHIQFVKNVPNEKIDYYTLSW